MDDLFGMLYGDLEPPKKLLTAVTNNMLDTLNTLLKDKTVNPDEKLQLHNGNRALHIACSNGNAACVRKLLDYGADADAENNFGLLPLSLALRAGHADCVRVLLQHGSPLSDPNLVWRSQQLSGVPAWLQHSPHCLQLLLLATPDLSWLGAEQLDQLRAKGLDLLKLFLTCGNRLSAERLNAIASQESDESRQWLKSFQRCHSLQHYARTSIRRCLHPNVIVAAGQLPIPPKVQEYLLVSDATSPLL